ncbi:MAG: IclR family transcriptional regulator [Maritimibacter sp.]
MAAESGTVGKALGLLDLVAAAGAPLRFAELQRASAMPKATLHRMIQTLAAEGMLMQEPETGAYRLGPRLLHLARAASQQVNIASIARPHLDALAGSADLSLQLAQLDYGHVVYLDRLRGQSHAAPLAGPGAIAPAYCTAEGKAMLAYLDPLALDQVLVMQSFQRFTPATLGSEALLRQALAKIGERGFAIELEEHHSGTVSVAVPILSVEDRVLGAVGLSGDASTLTRADLEAWVPQLRDCAEAIAVDLMQWTFPVE